MRLTDRQIERLERLIRDERKGELTAGKWNAVWNVAIDLVAHRDLLALRWLCTEIDPSACTYGQMLITRALKILDPLDVRNA